MFTSTYLASQDLEVESADIEGPIAIAG